MKNPLKLFIALALIGMLPVPLLRAQSTTAFTYQGRLLNSGQPANGYFDLQFTLFGDAGGGVPVANVIAKPPIAVSNGLFVTTLDFGAAGFPGNKRWLEIAVRPTGNTGSYVTLSPRQRITATPYALLATTIADGAVTAEKLSASGGVDGQVLKLAAGNLAWETGTGAGVSAVTAGTGLTGGVITNTGTIAIDTSVVPRLGAANSFSNPGNNFVGTFAGNGSGLTNMPGTALVDSSVNSNKLDAATRALLGTGGGSGNFNPSLSNSYNGRFTGNGSGLTNLNAGNVTSGLLNDARLSTNVALRTAAQTFSGSNTFSGVTVVTNPLNRFSGAFFGNGAGLSNVVATATNALAGDVTGLPAATTVARLRGVNLSATPPASNQLLRYDGTAWNPGAVFLGTDVSGILNPANGGSGLSSYTVGDLLFANGTTSLGKLADVATGSALLSGGVGVAPLWGKVGLTTHVSGILPVASGGTGTNSPAGARLIFGAAASGANADITSLSGLTTPLSPTQGGSGQGTYVAGDILFAPATNTLARRSIGTNGQVLTTRLGVPVWTNANEHNHFGQTWQQGNAVDGLYVANSSLSDAASGMTGIATGTTNVNYGLFGQTASTNGTGVQGIAQAASGFTAGVSGEVSSPDGTGVYGVTTASSGFGTGVTGESTSPNGTGVFGQALASSGTPVGVYGYCESPTGYGLYTPNRLYAGNNAFIGGHLTMGVAARFQADAGTTNLPGLTFFGNTGTGMFAPATNVLGFSTTGNQRMRISADGKIGVGRTATVNRFEVEGEASKLIAGGWLANSDAAIKTRVRRLDGAMDKLARVRPVAFHYTSDYLKEHPDIEDKVYYNVIAQEFAEVFPEAVKSSGETLPSGRAILQVDTHPATMYSIAAIQELNETLRQREREIAALRDSNQKLESRLSAIERLLEREQVRLDF
jgi:hypothetical protein